MYYLLFQFSLLLSLVTALSLQTTDTKEYCFQIKGKPEQFLHFSYLVRGRNEDNVALKVYYKFFIKISSITRKKGIIIRKRGKWMSLKGFKSLVSLRRVYSHWMKGLKLLRSSSKWKRTTRLNRESLWVTFRRQMKSLKRYRGCLRQYQGIFTSRMKLINS